MICHLPQLRWPWMGTVFHFTEGQCRFWLDLLASGLIHICWHHWLAEYDSELTGEWPTGEVSDNCSTFNREVVYFHVIKVVWRSYILSNKGWRSASKTSDWMHKYLQMSFRSVTWWKAAVCYRTANSPVTFSPSTHQTWTLGQWVYAAPAWEAVVRQNPDLETADGFLFASLEFLP